ncbi:glycosyltransferase [Streptomyces gibsoniae]|uniref:D-inositol 3-phosphate glycosyltransferase n=1 Tax=Streptomyces gibsoniae TaxID=3075529 RepID=A0ABU2TVQ2_9ACTN|nr:glycosyltransferase [Streptomyces sp. DSM 41699]MDT0465050.1 glycosyltransferase [Streptomyces sp. DSM 41699]
MNGRQRWAVLTESRFGVPGVRRAAAELLGQEPVVVMAASDAIRDVRGYRAELRRERISAVALLSNDPARRPFATPVELVLALAPTRERCIIDMSSPGECVPVGNRAALTVRCARDAATAGRRVLRDLVPRQERVPHGRPPAVPPGRAWVLALWRDAGEVGVGGAVSHVSGILNGFRQLGWRVALVTQGRPPEQLRAAVDLVRIAAPLPRGERFIRESAQLAANDGMYEAALALARRTPPSFVYERNSFLSRAGADISGHLGVPLVLEWNASVVWENRHWYREAPLKRVFQLIGARYERHTVRSARLVAAVSRPAAAMAIDAGADPGTVEVVANAVDAAGIPEPSPLPAREGARLGWVGSFGHWHGVDVAIESLRHLPPDVGLVLVGDGERRPECVRMADRLGVGDRITWTGSLPHGEALDVLSRCDVLVSPHVWKGTSPFFGSPTKLFEYMALGRPVVASRLEQIGEMLRDDVTAVLTEPGDPGSLAEGVRRVLDLPDRGAALGRTARREALAEHTWQRRAEQILTRLALPVTHPATERG